MVKRLVQNSGILLILGFSHCALTSLPPSDPSLQISPDPRVLKLLNRACWDCHSHQTEYPWYAKAPLVGNWIQSHIEEGREELNFSLWETYTPKEKSTKIDSLIEELESGEMPPWDYKLLHSKARLGPEEIAELVEWAKQMQREFE